MREGGYSAMLMLFLVVLVIFLIWAISQAGGRFNMRDQAYLDKLKAQGTPRPTCRSGDPTDCDDRFDVFRTDDQGRPLP